MLVDFPRVLGVSKPLLDVQIEFGKVEPSRNPRIAKKRRLIGGILPAKTRRAHDRRGALSTAEHPYGFLTF